MDHRASALAGESDDELVAKAQQNDDEAFEELVRRTSASSLRLAMSILRDRQEAEDEVQNSYFNAWRHVGQFQRESKFSTWMSRIVANHCLMRLRKTRGLNFLYLDEGSTDETARPIELKDQGPTPERDLGVQELSAVLQKEIKRLPPLLQRVLVLRDVDELSTAEVASILGISAAAVKSRLMRARLELRARLEKYGGRRGWATLTT
jgi:RNA polymerase sigma-70 factor (ECF subfamily)